MARWALGTVALAPLLGCSSPAPVATGTLPPLASLTSSPMATLSSSPSLPPPAASSRSATAPSELAPSSSPPATTAPTSQATGAGRPEVQPPAGALQYAPTEQGAYDLVRASYAAFDHAITTGDLSEARNLVSPTCACLKRAKGLLDNFRGKGQGFTGGDTTSLRVANFTESAPGLVSVTASYDTRAGDLIKRKTRKPVEKILARKGFQDAILLERRGEHWLMTSRDSLVIGREVS